MINQNSSIEYIKNIDIKHDSVISIGNFDGIHIGHTELINKTVDYAKINNLKSIIFSFDIHPQNIISKTKIQNLISNDEKKNILYEMGVDFVLFVPFDEELKNTSAYDFCDNILIKKLKVRKLILGEDAKFGKERLEAKNIKDYLEKKGVDVELVPLVLIEGKRISSTLIREYILNGNFKEVKNYLGHNFKIKGRVVHGKNRGSLELGFPTANISVGDDIIKPPIGVYETIVNYDNKKYKGATNIGKNPTFGENNLTIETFILDFDKLIYDEVIEIEFVEKIRDEIKFSKKEDLILQMKEDVEKIRSKKREF